jgi:hypothetical protein
MDCMATAMFLTPVRNVTERGASTRARAQNARARRCRRADAPRSSARFASSVDSAVRAPRSGDAVRALSTVSILLQVRFTSSKRAHDGWLEPGRLRVELLHHHDLFFQRREPDSTAKLFETLANGGFDGLSFASVGGDVRRRRRSGEGVERGVAKIRRRRAGGIGYLNLYSP